jgi:hypothetical protein
MKLQIASFALLIAVAVAASFVLLKEPKMDVKRVQSLNNRLSVTLRLGELASYTAEVHGSVGIAAEWDISDNGILHLVDEKKDYKWPDRAGMPGGDASVETFIFEAKAPGNSILTFRLVYRGTVEETKKVSVTVEP